MKMIMNDNWKAYMAFLLFGRNVTSTIEPIPDNASITSNYDLNVLPKPMIDKNGNSYNRLTFNSGSAKSNIGLNLVHYYHNNSNSGVYTHFAFSSGNTETSQFSIDDEITSGLTCALSCTTSSDSNGIKARYTLTLSATESISITKIYLVKPMLKLDSGVVVSSVRFRLGCVTLDEPISLSSGDSTTLSVDIVL